MVLFLFLDTIQQYIQKSPIFLKTNDPSRY